MVKGTPLETIGRGGSSPKSHILGAYQYLWILLLSNYLQSKWMRNNEGCALILLHSVSTRFLLLGYSSNNTGNTKLPKIRLKMSNDKCKLFLN